MTPVLAWLWAPLVLYVVLLGIGLLADRVLRAELPSALLAPVGLGIAIVLLVVAYRVAYPLALPALLVAAVAGFVLSRDGLRRRVWAPQALVAAGLVYALYMAPIVLSGEATWAGYNFVNDTATNFVLADVLAHHGFNAPAEASGTASTAAAFLNLGYPMGAFAMVGGIQPLTGAPLEAIYQPVMAVFAALGAMSITEIARRVGLRPLSTVVAAVLPMGGVLLYRYVLHGSIKEVALVSLLLTAAALAALASERRLSARVVALVAVTCLAMMLAFSFAAAAYAVVIGVAMLAGAYLSPQRPTLRHVAKLVGVVVAAGAVVLLPTLGSALDFATSARSSFASSGGDPTAQFGQLVRPLPATEGAGVWISRDYRFPADGAFNAELVTVAIVAAAVGLIACIVRRRWAPLMLLAVLAVPAVVLAPVSSPYIDGKLLMVLTPGVVLMGTIAALMGIEAKRRALRVLGVLALAGVGAGVLLSDAYSYRDARVAPEDRVKAMKDVAKHVPDRRLYLFNEWEEYGKFFMRDARVNPAAESSGPRRVELRRKRPLFGQWFDLDEQKLSYVQSFAGIIMRRSPSASRPPANYRRIYANDYYELWHRTKPVKVLAHLPLQGTDRATAIPDCAKVRALATRARPGDRLVAARRARVASLSPLRARRPAYWPVSGEIKNALTPPGAGTVSGALTASGTNRVWLRTSTVRPLTVTVDGREVGKADQVNTPGQWIEVGSVRLRPGSHRVEVRRPRSSWRPGESVYGYVGPVALESVRGTGLVSIPAADAARLCGKSWDWIELVRGRR